MMPPMPATGAFTPPMPGMGAGMPPGCVMPVMAEPEIAVHMIPGTNTYPSRSMFVRPLGGPGYWSHPNDVQAQVSFNAPARILSSHAYVTGQDVQRHWTDPWSAPKAHSEYLNYLERDRIDKEHGGASRLPPPNMPPEVWAQMDERADAFPGQVQMTEVNASVGPLGAPHPSSDAQEKVYYNTYCYTNYQRPNPAPGDFHERYMGTYDDMRRQKSSHERVYVDTWAQMRHAKFIQDKIDKEIREEQEREFIESGEGLRDTPYVDKYSGAHLIAVGNKLAEIGEVQSKFKIRNNDWQDSAPDPSKEVFSFDSLRCLWPFDAPQRNKLIHHHVYDWFDRRNPYISRDEDYEIVEMNGAYADPQLIDGTITSLDELDMLEHPIEYEDKRTTDAALKTRPK